MLISIKLNITDFQNQFLT